MKTVAEVLTVPNFLAFVQSKPAEEAFAYEDGRNCAVAQFLKSEGVPFAWVGGFSVSLTEEQRRTMLIYGFKGPVIPQEIQDSMMMGEASTFGTVAKNLAKLVASRG